MLKPESWLRPYQITARDYALENPYCALWLSMGLGKTVSVLTAIRDLLATGEARKVLVLAPKLVAYHTWPDEVAEWEHLQHLAIHRLDGDHWGRLGNLLHPAPIHTINHENLAWLWNTLGKHWPYDTVVIDETSRGYKNPKRRTTPKKGTRGKRNLTRFGAAVNVRGLPQVRRIVELTGTPAPNGPLDLWAQIYLLDQGERLGKTFEMYKRRYFNENPYSYEITPLPGAEEEIYQRIDDIVISMSEEDYLSLPERIYQEVPVTLPPKVKEQYDYFRRHFVMERHDDIEAVNSGALVNKCLQLCNGSMYREDGEDQWFHDEKLHALQRIVEDAQADEEQVLVAYWFQFDLARLKKAFPKAVVLGEDPDAIQKWKRRQAGIMFIHPASGGHGLNLQAGGRLMVWYGLTWDLDLYLQLNKRLHRGEQSQPVIIKHIIAEGTDDERVLPRLTEKNASQTRLLKAVAV